MSDASVTPEPSMDEILQKIQRIIAEDEQPADQPAAAPPRSAEILNLTEAVGDNGTVRYLNPVEAAPPEPELPPPAPRPPERRIEPVPKRPEAANRGSGERLLSDSTAGQAAAAFAQLAAIQRERRRVSEFPMGGGAERTLEDVIREMLRPMLQGWLDDKLPEILERLVRAELARALGEITPG
jgi:cell pole-organizing protein PopZ